MSRPDRRPESSDDSDPASASTPTPEITVRYWAGASQAAGLAQETCRAKTVGQALAQAQDRHPDLQEVLRHCSILLDGRRTEASSELVTGQTLEVLPPFAGG